MSKDYSQYILRSVYCQFKKSQVENNLNILAQPDINRHKEILRILFHVLLSESSFYSTKFPHPNTPTIKKTTAIYRIPRQLALAPE